VVDKKPKKKKKRNPWGTGAERRFATCVNMEEEQNDKWWIKVEIRRQLRSKPEKKTNILITWTAVRKAAQKGITSRGGEALPGLRRA